jgi:hypothetical protein
MAKGPKKAEPVEELDEDLEDEDSGDDFDGDLDDDEDADDSGELAGVDLLLNASATGAQSARRRVEDYLEMKRAARELGDLEDFDFD